MAKRVITISSPDTEACPDAPCATSLKACSKCDGFLLIPINPAILIEGALYLEGTIVSGPVLEAGVNNWMVEIEDTLLTDPNASFSQCDYRVCCNDCIARFVKVLINNLAGRVAALEAL